MKQLAQASLPAENQQCDVQWPNFQGKLLPQAESNKSRLWESVVSISLRRGEIWTAKRGTHCVSKCAGAVWLAQRQRPDVGTGVSMVVLKIEQGNSRTRQTGGDGTENNSFELVSRQDVVKFSSFPVFARADAKIPNAQ